MSRWIDAEWLINFFVDIPDNFTLTIGNLRATVNDAPSIEIIRCGECKYRRICCRPCYKADDSYCSDGEREGE